MEGMFWKLLLPHSTCSQIWLKYFCGSIATLTTSQNWLKNRLPVYEWINNVVFIWSHVQPNLAHSSSGWMIASPCPSQKWTKKQTPNSAFVSVNQVGFWGNLVLLWTMSWFFWGTSWVLFIKKVMLNLLGWIVDGWTDGLVGSACKIEGTL